MKKLSSQQVKQIIKKHFKNKISQTQLAKDYKVTRTWISRLCERVGVSPLNKDYKLDDKKIIDLYVNEKMSVKRIADILKVTPRPIRRRLKINGIEKRPLSSRSKFEKEIIHYHLKLKIWVAKVIERDGLKCQMCGGENAKGNLLEAHHIIPIREIENPDLLIDVNNGITLCRKCHMKIHFKERDFEKLFKEKLHSSV